MKPYSADEIAAIARAIKEHRKEWRIYASRALADRTRCSIEAFVSANKMLQGYVPAPRAMGRPTGAMPAIHQPQRKPQAVATRPAARDAALSANVPDFLRDTFATFRAREEHV